MESLVNWFVNSWLGQHVSREALVFIVSLFPISELRGGMLVGTMLDVPMWRAIGLSMLGNFIPIPFILLFIKKIFDWLRNMKRFRPFVERMENRAAKHREGIERGEFWGLFIFVGIPLPVTGAWTGSLVAAIFNVKFRRALLAESLGICLSAAIMTIISYGIIGNIIR